MRPTFDMLSSTSIVPWRPPEPELTTATTTTTTFEQEPLDVFAMVEAAVTGLLAEPVLLGVLHGAMIYLDRTMPEGELVACDGKTGEALWRVPVRHPLLAGTKLVAAAEAYL